MSTTGKEIQAMIQQEKLYPLYSVGTKTALDILQRINERIDEVEAQLPKPQEANKEIDRLYYHNLGTENGWKETPEEVTRCIALNHLRKTINLNGSRTSKRTECDICRHYYFTDSGD